MEGRLQACAWSVAIYHRKPYAMSPKCINLQCLFTGANLCAPVDCSVLQVNRVLQQVHHLVLLVGHTEHRTPSRQAVVGSGVASVGRSIGPTFLWAKSRTAWLSQSTKYYSIMYGCRQRFRFHYDTPVTNLTVKVFKSRAAVEPIFEATWARLLDCTTTIISSEL